jgi:molybdate transport system ATP-binding protein
VSAVSVDAERDLGRFRLRARFEAPDGLTVLFGPSGAGKSLTLALIAGLVRPDRGVIRLREHTLDDTSHKLHVPTRQRRVGFVFQDALLFPHRSVLDNVALAIRGVSRAERRRLARHWLERVGAEGLDTARPGTLSGGQRQRVALARALATGPELLLLDEPLSALDLETRRQLRALVRGLVRETRVPALFVTHDHDEVRDLADSVVLYRIGEVERVVGRAGLDGALRDEQRLLESRGTESTGSRDRELDRAIDEAQATLARLEAERARLREATERRP